MKSVGLVISHKENEQRRALCPWDIPNIKNKKFIHVEQGYGLCLDISDEEYIRMGVNIVPREEILQKDIICDPKIGDADYLDELKGQTIFGWIHAVQNRSITDKMIEHGLTGYAWEDMFEEGRHCFWRNNEIAGEAAVFHAFMCHGVFPHGKKVAVLGRGNTARGAIKMLNHLGAEVMAYDRKTEQLFRKEMGSFDVLVNAVLWDTTRNDHIVYKADLQRLKKGCMIIDISCDRHGGIETSIPTTIEEPTYIVNGIRHYVVDHTPSLFWKTTTESLSEVFSRYIDQLIEDKPSDVLHQAHIFEKGEILDHRIIDFQNR